MNDLESATTITLAKYEDAFIFDLMLEEWDTVSRRMCAVLTTNQLNTHATDTINIIVSYTVLAALFRLTIKLRNQHWPCIVLSVLTMTLRYSSTALADYSSNVMLRLQKPAVQGTMPLYLVYAAFYVYCLVNLASNLHGEGQ